MRAEPSLTGEVLDWKIRGAIVHVAFTERNWVCLRERYGSDNSQCGWMMVDGSGLGCGVLLRRVAGRLVWCGATQPLHIKRYWVIGERHSGTNLMRELLSKALQPFGMCDCNGVVEVDDWHRQADCRGWHKHWPGVVEDNGVARWYAFDAMCDTLCDPSELCVDDRRRGGDDADGTDGVEGFLSSTLVVFITRAPHDWVQAMHRLPHHAPFHLDTSLDDFCQMPWDSYLGNDFYCIAPPDRAQATEESHAAASAEPWEDAERAKLLEDLVQPANLCYADRDELGVPFTNVLRLRSFKARYMLGFRHRFEHFAHVRYDNLCADPVRTLRDVLDASGVRFNQLRLQHVCEKVVSSRSVYPPLPTALAEFVNAELDWQVESEMGYERTLES